MFEKEAEDNKPPYAYCTLDVHCELWKDGFQKGAEYGYNKAKEELEKDANRLFLEGAERVEELEEENERLKKDSEENQDLATIAYMQGAGKYKAKLDKAKEIIRELCGTVRVLNNPNTQLTNVDVYLADTESFLKENKC